MVVMTLAFISIQYVLVLCNSIGTPLDPKYIDIGKQLAIVLFCWVFSSLCNEFLVQVYCSVKQSLCGNTPCIQRWPSILYVVVTVILYWPLTSIWTLPKCNKHVTRGSHVVNCNLYWKSPINYSVNKNSGL